MKYVKIFLLNCHLFGVSVRISIRIEQIYWHTSYAKRSKNSSVNKNEELWNWCHHYRIAVTLENMKNENLEQLTRRYENRKNSQKKKIDAFVSCCIDVKLYILPYVKIDRCTQFEWCGTSQLPFHFILLIHICILIYKLAIQKFHLAPVATNWTIECRDPNKNDETQRWMNKHAFFLSFCWCFSHRWRCRQSKFLG